MHQQEQHNYLQNIAHCLYESRTAVHHTQTLKIACTETTDDCIGHEGATMTIPFTHVHHTPVSTLKRNAHLPQNNQRQEITTTTTTGAGLVGVSSDHLSCNCAQQIAASLTSSHPWQQSTHGWLRVHTACRAHQAPAMLKIFWLRGEAASLPQHMHASVHAPT